MTSVISGRRIRVAIATAGRFHVLDLARELDQLGFDVMFYSYIPRSRARSFGLRDSCQVTLFPRLLPLLALHRLARGFASRWQEQSLIYALNRAVVAKLRPCDVFICMSGIYLEAAEYARRRYGALIFLERGSTHVLTQAAILRSLPNVREVTSFALERELTGYSMADRIVLPSMHARDTFSHDASCSKKLFVNPYGVDLDQFPLRGPAPPSVPMKVLYVGTWSYRKGVDVLTKALMPLNGIALLHVGSLGDAPFPNDDRFTHYEPVPQWDLSRIYAEAHVFAIASREEGLALVQPQALASGLPIVCTNRTGGLDLGHNAKLAQRVHAVPADNVAELSAAIASSVSKVKSGGYPPLDAKDRELLSWRQYGKRYAEELVRAMG